MDNISGPDNEERPNYQAIFDKVINQLPIDITHKEIKMTKIFAPKITPGEWSLRPAYSFRNEISGMHLMADNEWLANSIQGDDNARAFLALPHLLKVLGAARELKRVFIDYDTTYKFNNIEETECVNELFLSIDELDDTFGTEQ
jgi:hypothetical protein